MDVKSNKRKSMTHRYNLRNKRQKSTPNITCTISKLSSSSDSSDNDSQDSDYSSEVDEHGNIKDLIDYDYKSQPDSDNKIVRRLFVTPKKNIEKDSEEISLGSVNTDEEEEDDDEDEQDETEDEEDETEDEEDETDDEEDEEDETEDEEDETENQEDDENNNYKLSNSSKNLIKRIVFNQLGRLKLDKNTAQEMLNNINGVKQPICEKTVQEQQQDAELRKILKKYSTQDKKYYNSLSLNQQQQIIASETALTGLNTDTIPPRFRILESSLNNYAKSLILQKINTLDKLDPSNNEYHKLNTWVSGAMRIPFGKYSNLPITNTNTSTEISQYLINVKNKLDNVVFGHTTAKTQIIEIICQWISNPRAIGNVIALQGPMGIGKTTIVKDGIANVINKPFSFVTLGGATDAAFLEGHGYTYEGSTWGRIASILMECGCMDPIIYFDELDKISETPKGEEIANLLIHLTDPSQNTQFHDKYFTGLDFDLSRALFIFSYNDESKISPILRDRMYHIKAEGFNTSEKTTIAKDYLIPAIIKNVGLSIDEIVFPTETLTHIIKEFTDENGVRELKRHLTSIITKINVMKLVYSADMSSTKIDILPQKIADFKLPITITTQIVDKFIPKDKTESFPLHMYS